MSLEDNIQIIKELSKDVYTSSKRRLSNAVKFSLAAPTYYRKKGDDMSNLLDAEACATLGTYGGIAFGVVAYLPFSIYNSLTDNDPGMVFQVSSIPILVSLTTNQISAFYEIFRAKKQEIVEKENQPKDLVDEIERIMNEK